MPKPDSEPDFPFEDASKETDVQFFVKVVDQAIRNSGKH
jgi:hypothetical protein